MVPLLLLFLMLACAESKIRFQSFGVRGTLLCGDAPTPGVRVRLWDNDMGELVDSPKQNSFTDFDGNFAFDDWTPYNEDVDPVIRIAHDCNDGVKTGQRLFKFRIPKMYVFEGKEAPKDQFFNLGTINLEFKPFDEERYYKGDIGKRDIIRPYSHKVYRARRNEQDVINEDVTTKAADSSEDDPCDFGLCTFSQDKKRREANETGESDEIIKKEESEQVDTGCTSDGACPIHLTRKRREHRGRRELARRNAAESGENSDEIVKKDEKEEEGCSDGACPIDFKRKRRHESPDADCTDTECPINIEKAKKNSTKTTKFRGRDESPEDRVDPW